jgi:basic membrane lipoprotein Med (substrate-binding protein (PBP1-ABC) superfamily)
MNKKTFWLLGLMLIAGVLLTACGQPVEEVGGFQIPGIEKGKFNVGMVLIGPHDDGGWSQAHYEALLLVTWTQWRLSRVNSRIQCLSTSPGSSQILRTLAT